MKKEMKISETIGYHYKIIPGLCGKPTVGWDDADAFGPNVDTEVDTHLHFTPCVAQTFQDIFSRVKNNCSAILEIGVWGDPHHEDNAGRSTEFLRDMKNKDTIYLGIDNQDRSHVHDPENNMNFLQCDSTDKDAVNKEIKNLGIDEFDFIFIDGFHSINMVLWEWEHYVVRYLSKQGIAAFHDTNSHPGPYALFEVIDPTIFVAEKYCLGNDYGIGAIWYK